jgi:tetratricopeptide (TPR) repeat protein
MDEREPFTGHIHREEELQVLQEVARVREDRLSRALLLYGPGGIGKTSLVRELARARGLETRTIWVDPIDVDDPEFWLLSNLERRVADHLDPEARYFALYHEYISRLPRYTRPRIGHETVVSHLGRIKRVFAQCYKEFVKESGKTPVIVFDTVESIRGMYLLTTLTQWMKALPATLFILSGRAVPSLGGVRDPIRYELEDPHQPIPCTTIYLGEFGEQAALDYLRGSGMVTGLSEDEKAKLVRLTRGHPLWLAFTISYLRDRGMPEEAEHPFADIDRQLPYGLTPDHAGRGRVEAFKRRLVTPYRETDFWHECDKRLAVVRQSVTKETWLALMSDRSLPEGVTSHDEAWDLLLKTPWIRARANQRCVTLHDAVAEELAQRIIPLHDQNQSWRHEQWQRAVHIYTAQIDAAEPALSERIAIMDSRLHLLDQELQLSDERRVAGPDESAFIDDVARLDAGKRELNQLKAMLLYYMLLSDHVAGCRLFLDLFGQARHEHDILFQELLVLEMQRFLPGGVEPDAASDVTGGAIGAFRQWLMTGNSHLYLEIGLSICGFLIENEQAEAATRLLGELPEDDADVRQRYRLKILLGNAYMRTPGRVKDGLEHFQEALSLAEAIDTSTADPQKLVAEAHKEMGYYYRNEGLWKDADYAYEKAHHAIAVTLASRADDEDREEMASILTNWAYVKGLRGAYREAANLVESAITVRQHLGRRRETGISWSVCGEVYRYERRFHKAWDAYAEAERIFQEERNWSWLGLIYQEQAICLFQAAEEGVNLVPSKDAIEQAKQLITLALDICRDRAVRGYPSALNRAGRIYGRDYPDTGLKHLSEAIEQAQRLSDGWFWFTSIIEYVELCYRAWVRTEDDKYLEWITSREPDVAQVMSEYQFPDLRGRWRLLHGHLGIHDWRKTGQTTLLAEALENYQQGFTLLAQEFAGLSGALIIPTEFTRFGTLLRQLPSDIQTEWLTQLRRAWSNPDRGSTVLLARLEELY